ncbi:MFS general substrate transporter [Podospora australis]|uniref:MFS general substrate transporter n=1 Tax=Podospora australis TaxID=1536484 RepID=A0AAN6WUT2_9PEZI|nr:MFS general substrate transporter [Podospora australis]
MGLDLDLEKELGLGQDGTVSKAEGKRMSFRPPPPAKEPPSRRPPPLPSSLDALKPGSILSEPPNRPLPPRPVSKVGGGGLSRSTTSASTAPSRPPPTRPPPLRPQAPLGMNPPTRPGTAATTTTTTTTTASFDLPKNHPEMPKRISWMTSSSLAATRRTKYGTGKHSNVELVPQPSDDPDDPLNWPTWRKELNFFSLMLLVSMTGVTKTIFTTVNAQLAETYQVSYTAVSALTGVPLILSAITGLVSLIASRIWGKRPLYLVSLLLLFIGTVWNTNVATSYSQCMAARIFQGLGWGAFDSLVLGSIQDTYFEHQRNLKIALHSIISISATWGSPLLGGVASQGEMGFGQQFTILSAFFVVAVPAIALGAPETAFDRAYTLAQTPATAMTGKYKRSLPLGPRKLFSLETFYEYIVRLKPYSYSPSSLSPTRPTLSLQTILQAPRASIAPTTTLLFLVSFLPSASLWGFSSSLSLLFHPLPFDLSPSAIGALFTASFLLSIAIISLSNFWPFWRRNFSPKLHMAAIALGTTLSFIGILTFGLHINASMTPSPSDPLSSTTSVFALDYLGSRVNLPAVSFVLGLLSAGVFILDSTVRPLIKSSTEFTSSNFGVAQRNTSDMSSGVCFWRTFFSGIFVMAVPNAAWTWDGLRALCIGFSIAQMVVGATVGVVWWLFAEQIKRWDGRVMRLVDLDMLKRSGSFFDTD